MKKFLVLIALFLPLLASAHVLEKEGGVGAVLHIDPEDDPIIGQPAHFYFELKDTENRLDSENCQCTVTISKEGKEFFKKEIITPTLTYTFDEKGIYQISITDGKRFTLNYDVRVDRESDNAVNHTLHYMIMVSGVAIIGLFTFTNVFNKKS